MCSGGLKHTPRCLLDQGPAVPFPQDPTPVSMGLHTPSIKEPEFWWGISMLFIICVTVVTGNMGGWLVPILVTTVFTPCVEPADVDIPKPRLFIASRSTHSTPSKAFSNLWSLFTASCSSEQAYLQAEDAHHGSALAKSHVEAALFQFGSS